MIFGTLDILIEVEEPPKCSRDKREHLERMKIIKSNEPPISRTRIKMLSRFAIMADFALF